MTRKHCQKCGSALQENANFCGQCGQVTKEGFRALERREKLVRILVGLDQAFNRSRLSKSTYESSRVKYQAELSKIDSEIPLSVVTNAAGSVVIPPRKEGEERSEESVIYAAPPPMPFSRALAFVAAAALLVVASAFLTWSAVGEGFENAWIQRGNLFLFSLSGPAIYLMWMYLNDRFEREPITFIVLVLGWGAFAGFLSFIGNTFLSSIGLGTPWFTAPLIEETTKGFGVYWMSRNHEFNDSMDGMVYGFASGTGFAWMENFFYIIYVYEENFVAALFRIFVFSYGHGLYTAFTGWALGTAKVKKGFTMPWDSLPGLVVAMLAHGLYNSFLIGELGLPTIVSIIVWVFLTDGFFTLVLYSLIKRAWTQERIWLYDRGLAPR